MPLLYLSSLYFYMAVTSMAFGMSQVEKSATKQTVSGSFFLSHWNLYWMVKCSGFNWGTHKTQKSQTTLALGACASDHRNWALEVTCVCPAVKFYPELRNPCTAMVSVLVAGEGTLQLLACGVLCSGTRCNWWVREEKKKKASHAAA